MFSTNKKIGLSAMLNGKKWVMVNKAIYGTISRHAIANGTKIGRGYDITMLAGIDGGETTAEIKRAFIARHGGRFIGNVWYAVKYSEAKAAAVAAACVKCYTTCDNSVVRMGDPAGCAYCDSNRTASCPLNAGFRY